MAGFLHLPLDPLNRAAPNTKLSSDLHCPAVPQLPTRRLRPLKPRVDPLSDHAALEFGEGASFLKHELSGPEPQKRDM
jgi:hypothetical protein